MDDECMDGCILMGDVVYLNKSCGIRADKPVDVEQRGKGKPLKNVCVQKKTVSRECSVQILYINGRWKR